MKLIYKFNIEKKVSFCFLKMKKNVTYNVLVVVEAVSTSRLVVEGCGGQFLHPCRSLRVAIGPSSEVVVRRGNSNCRILVGVMQAHQDVICARAKQVIGHQVESYRFLTNVFSSVEMTSFSIDVCSREEMNVCTC